jgi:hypothetical protein
VGVVHLDTRLIGRLVLVVQEVVAQVVLVLLQMEQTELQTQVVVEVVLDKAQKELVVLAL